MKYQFRQELEYARGIGDCFDSHKVASNWPSEFHIMGTINGYIHAAHADKENILIGRTMKMIVKRNIFFKQHGNSSHPVNHMVRN